MARLFLIPVLFGVILTTGCASVPRPDLESDDSPRPKTLLAWEAGRKVEPETTEPAEPPEPETIATDRPDFTEASSTVGKGRIQLESGYTYFRDRTDGVTSHFHSYPEALLRIGMITDWFELRIGQNFGNSRTVVPEGIFNSNGGLDLYVGAKIALTEQKGALPESALVIQSQIPTGHSDFSSGRVLPGLNLLYGWDVIPDLLTFAGSTQGNIAVDDNDHSYLLLAQSFTAGYRFTDRLAMYTEWFAFFPSGATAEGVTAQHYLDGGFTYLVTPNFQLDIRAGIGLSRSADDFFAGTGFAVRY